MPEGKFRLGLGAQAPAVSTTPWHPSLGESVPAPVLIFWNVVTNEAQGSFVHTCLVPEELGWLLEGMDSSVSCPWPGVGAGRKRVLFQAPVQHCLCLGRESVQREGS